MDMDENILQQLIDQGRLTYAADIILNTYDSRSVPSTVIDMLHYRVHKNLRYV